MISRAIMQRLPNSSRFGASAYAIAKFIETNYPVIDSFRSHLSRALKKGVEAGWLIQTKRSYRLSQQEKRKIMAEKKFTQPIDLEEFEYRQRLHKRVKRRLSFDDITIP
jgi:hypothetical protein